jgi:hypothetical protein
MAAPQTLYQIANYEIRRCIDVYLKLAKQSKGLTTLLPAHLTESRGRVIVMAGLGVSTRPATAEEVCSEWQRRQALSFDLETGITAGVYMNLRIVAETFYEQLNEATGGFTRFETEYLMRNPYLLPLLPLLQHLAGIFSKAKLKELVGSVSDNRISKPAAHRLAKLLAERIDPPHVVKGEILKPPYLVRLPPDSSVRLTAQSPVNRAPGDFSPRGNVKFLMERSGIRNS